MFSLGLFYWRGGNFPLLLNEGSKMIVILDSMCVSSFWQIGGKTPEEGQINYWGLIPKPLRGLEGLNNALILARTIHWGLKHSYISNRTELNPAQF